MDSTLKLHLRIAELPGQTYRVLTLRPSFGARFSNNRFHDTWHLLTDAVGARVLARLWWGLSYQRQRGTILMLDAPHIVSTPFEADAAAPCLFALAGSPTEVSLDEDHLIALRKWLRKPGAPATTVKLQTFGLTAELEQEAREEGDEHALREARVAAWRTMRSAEREPLWAQERMSKRAGFLCYTAPPEVMRWQALAMHRMPNHLYRGMNYHYLAEGAGGRPGGNYHPPEGEVQVFSDFAERVSAAKQGRLRALEDPQRRALTPAEQERTWSAAERVLAERLALRQRRSAQRRERAALEME
jgi:hypothetical protein